MKKILVLGVLVLAVPLLNAAPSGAGDGFVRFIEIEKVVVGPGSSGPYTLTGVCTVTPGGSSPISDGEVIEIGIQNAQSDTCTITETETLGATVTYSCTELPFGDEGATCDGDNTVSWEGDLTGAVHITVTNTFEEPTTTTTGPTSTTGATTTTAQAAAAAAVTAAVPTFTG
jgi:hypothetical protein